jgi:hypothetical protein
MVLWGIERTLDEHLWLGEDGHLGSLLVQIAGIGLVVGGTTLLVVTRRRWREWLRTHGPGSNGTSDLPPPLLSDVAVAPNDRVAGTPTEAPT